MDKKSAKVHLKAIERRGKWFKRQAKKGGMMARAEEKIDAYFAEDELERSHAMFMDMLTDSYPFTKTAHVEDRADIVREKYGFDWVEIDIMLDIIDELADEFPDEFMPKDNEDKNEEKEISEFMEY